MYSSTTGNSERPVRINVLQRSNTTSHSSSSSQPSTRKSSVKLYPAPTPPSPRDPTKVVLSGKGLKHAHLDRPAVFGIDGRNAGPGRCCIQCISIELNIIMAGHDFQSSSGLFIKLIIFIWDSILYQMFMHNLVQPQ